VVNTDGTHAHWQSPKPLTDESCETCHELTQHQSGTVRLWATTPGSGDVMTFTPGTTDPAALQKLSDFCGLCHSLAAHGGHTVPGDWQPVCVACHDPHNGTNTNLALVAKTVRNQTLAADEPVVFTALTGPGSFSDGVGANDGICQVCHTTTTHHRYDGTGTPHHEAENCTTCHAHASGFVPQGGTSCVACHSSPQGSRPKIVNADGSGGHHLAGAVLTDADCVVCHDTSQHQGGTVRLWGNPGSGTGALAVTGDPNQLVPFCGACHTGTDHPVVHNTGAAWQPACTECHALHEPANSNLALVANPVRNQTLSTDMTVVFTALTGAGSFSDGVGANDGICQVCHTATSHHRYDGSGSAHHAGENCTGCHAHANGFVPQGGTSCIGCHSSPQGSRPKIVNADGSGGHHLAGQVLTDADCVTCHDTSQHQGGTVRLWGNPGSGSGAFAVTGDPNQLVPFCGACHTGADQPTIHNTGAAWQPACTECHALHQPANSNLALVANPVRNQTLSTDMTVVFTALTGAGSFSDGVGANDGICQVCHTTTSHHRYDGGGSAHHAGENCTGCHAHASGFVPAGGTSCIGCHTSPQGSRRAIVGEFGLASHHVGGAVTDADCQVCHDQSEHQGGHVRLRNVDDPGNPAAVVTLNGSPLTNATEAKPLEPFCLACHDANGAGGSAPFSDGVMPPVIDAGLWAAASHSAGQTTCVGDGETFGCHSTGHGSQKVTLLAPWNGGQAPVPGDPLRQEEGMCYSCHDANGPAATDMQAIFSNPSHHKVSALEQTDGSKVECRNCHNPHTAKHAAPLINPDTGAVWTGTSQAFCLTCHDGTPPAGVTFPPVANGTGFNKAAFVGTTHDNAFDWNGCLHCHNSHGSSEQSLLRAKYNVADHTQYVSANYAMCWLCHSENAVLQHNNAFGDRHQLHVADEQAPCILCHDVHRGFDAGEPGLIDLNYSVQHGYDIQFIDGKNGSTAFWLNAGQTEGNCYISCHAEDHTPKTYTRTNVSTTSCFACH
jgi:hypothetical protein